MADKKSADKVTTTTTTETSTEGVEPTLPPPPPDVNDDVDSDAVENTDMGSDRYRQELAQGYVGSLGTNPDGSDRDANYHTLPAVVQRAQDEQKEREAAQQNRDSKAVKADESVKASDAKREGNK